MFSKSVFYALAGAACFAGATSLIAVVAGAAYLCSGAACTGSGALYGADTGFL
jgi:hypothetical protein